MKKLLKSFCPPILVNFIKTKIKMLIKKYLFRRDVCIQKGHLKVYKYHQSEVKKDNKFLEWVKRDSYIKNGSIK